GVLVDTEQRLAGESVDAILRPRRGRGRLATPFREALVDGAEREDVLDEACRLPRLAVDVRAAADVFMIGSGALAPLAGFLDEGDYRSVVATGRLLSGAPLGGPGVLRGGQPEAAALRGRERVALSPGRRPIGILQVEDTFAAPADGEARYVYGTDDEAHPGVAALHRSGSHALAGTVTAFAPPADALGRYD